MNQGTKTRRPRHIARVGRTATYTTRKASPLALLAFTVWGVMARTIEYVSVLIGFLVIALAAVIVPLVLWF